MHWHLGKSRCGDEHTKSERDKKEKESNLAQNSSEGGSSLEPADAMSPFVAGLPSQGRWPGIIPVGPETKFRGRICEADILRRDGAAQV